MRSWLRILFVVLLAVQASELFALIAPEPCAIAAQDEEPDQQCPPICARCACCTQAIVIAEPFSLVLQIVPLDAEPTPDPLALSAMPSDVLHVPKSGQPLSL